MPPTPPRTSAPTTGRTHTAASRPPTQCQACGRPSGGRRSAGSTPPPATATSCAPARRSPRTPSRLARRVAVPALAGREAGSAAQTPPRRRVRSCRSDSPVVPQGCRGGRSSGGAQHDRAATRQPPTHPTVGRGGQRHVQPRARLTSRHMPPSRRHSLCRRRGRHHARRSVPVVTAYILVQTEVGKAAQVAKDIAEITGVQQTEDVTGPYDVIVRAEARNLDELGKLVVARGGEEALLVGLQHQLVGQHLVCGGHPRYGLDAVGTPGDIQARDLPRADPVAIAAARHDVEPPTRAVLVTLAG